MLKKVEKTAKNLDEALKLAAEELGVSKEELGYEITREVGKGFMRLLVSPEVDVTAWIAADAEKEAKKQEKAEKAASVPETEKKTVYKTNEPKKNAAKKVEEKNNARPTETPKRAKDAVDDNFVMPKEAVDDAKYFVSGVLSKIGIKYELNVKIDGNTLNIDITGEKMGLLIGKRGDTLDAIQTLTGLYVNRDKSNPYIKINIDTENYRKKREETLIRLAHGLARSVVRDGKSATLEPMTANERRIIHSALQNNPAVRTYSVGEEPNRRMVVALNDRQENRE